MGRRSSKFAAPTLWDSASLLLRSSLFISIFCITLDGYFSFHRSQKWAPHSNYLGKLVLYSSPSLYNQRLDSGTASTLDETVVH